MNSEESTNNGQEGGEGQEVELSFDLAFDDPPSPDSKKEAEKPSKKGSHVSDNPDGSRLNPVVSAETEALMRRLRSGHSVANGPPSPGGPPAQQDGANSSSQPPLMAQPLERPRGNSLLAAPPLGAYQHPHAQSMSSLSLTAPGSYPGSYGGSPSFAELGLSKTAESLAASEGVAAEDANGVIVYGEPSTTLEPMALLEAISELRVDGEVLRHWHREGQHFCFVEFSTKVNTKDVAERIAKIVLDGVTLTAEPCKRITPGRDPRTHRATSEFKSSTLVLKNLPFQLRQESLTEILQRMPRLPTSINYHYDTTGAFRGMAFVKYATIEDAYGVFDELNGLDIMGRALRVEYKRHSSDRDAQHQYHGDDGHGSIAAALGGRRRGGSDAGKKQRGGGRHSRNRQVALDPSELSNDARAFYEQLVMFKENPRLNELAFPPSLTVHQRKQLHYLADQIGGLTHAAVGEGSARFLVVSKQPIPHMSNQRGAGHSYSGGGFAGSPRGNHGDNSATSRSWHDDTGRSPGRSPGRARGAWGGRAKQGGNRSRSGTADASNHVTRQPKGPTGEKGFGK